MCQWHYYTVRHKFTVQGCAVSIGFLCSGGGLVQAAMGMGFRQVRMPLNRMGVALEAAFSDLVELRAWPVPVHRARCGVPFVSWTLCLPLERQIQDDFASCLRAI